MKTKQQQMGRSESASSVRKQSHTEVAGPPANSSTTAHAIKRQKYFVLVIDCADMNGARNVPSSYDIVVAADSPEEASRLAVAEKSVENGYGPDEDGGFLAVYAYDRDHLQYLLNEMDDD